MRLVNQMSPLNRNVLEVIRAAKSDSIDARSVAMHCSTSLECMRSVIHILKKRGLIEHTGGANIAEWRLKLTEAGMGWKPSVVLPKSKKPKAGRTRKWQQPYMSKNGPPIK